MKPNTGGEKERTEDRCGKKERELQESQNNLEETMLAQKERNKV